MGPYIYTLCLEITNLSVGFCNNINIPLEIMDFNTYGQGVYLHVCGYCMGNGILSARSANKSDVMHFHLAQLRPHLKETLFYEWTDLLSRVTRSGQFFFNGFFFPFLVAKMTPLKMQESPKKSDSFLKKNFGKYSQLFSKILAKFSSTLTKNGRFNTILAKKNPPKMEHLGRSCP